MYLGHLCWLIGAYLLNSILATLFYGGSMVLKKKKICRQWERPGFDPWVEKTPWGRKWQHNPVFLPGRYHRQRSLWATVSGVTKS